jgi:hypothetical protein
MDTETKDYIAEVKRIEEIETAVLKPEIKPFNKALSDSEVDSINLRYEKFSRETGSEFEQFIEWAERTGQRHSEKEVKQDIGELIRLLIVTVIQSQSTNDKLSPEWVVKQFMECWRLATNGVKFHDARYLPWDKCDDGFKKRIDKHMDRETYISQYVHESVAGHFKQSLGMVKQGKAFLDTIRTGLNG